ncbi:hypothetical protein PFISCL1PPCAC_5067, partial [Pristionchus fissidentatus]
TGMGPCVEIFCKQVWAPVGTNPVGHMERGVKLFEDGDCVRFLLTARPREQYYVALSSRFISVFRPDDMHDVAELCELGDEIVGHGKIEGIEFKREKGTNQSSKFKLLIALSSGTVKRIKVTVKCEHYRNFSMHVITTVENKSAGGKLIAAPIIDKTNLALIFEDTIVRPDKTGRQVVAAGETPWKGKVLLATDDGEIHIVKMSDKVGDGRMPIYGSGKSALSSDILKIPSPNAFAVWGKEIVVGNEKGSMYRLEKSNLHLIDEYELEYGPICFLQNHKGKETSIIIIFHALTIYLMIGSVFDVVLPGMGPCVEIFHKQMLVREGDVPVAHMERGKKLFEDGDCVRFLLTARPREQYYVAISSRFISVFRPTLEKESHDVAELCESGVEIVGHGKIEEVRY